MNGHHNFDHTTGVLDVIWAELDVGETSKVIDRLPHAVRVLWLAIARGS